MLIGKSSYEWVTIYYATLSIGAILVPLDREWGKEELLETAKRADVSFLLCDNDIKEKAEFIAENTELLAAPVFLGADGENSVKALTEAGVAVDTAMVKLEEPIKNLGTFDVTVAFMADVTVVLKLAVVAE